MKNSILLSRFGAVLMAAAVLMCTSCGASRNSGRKTADEARVERLIQERLDARSFRVDVDRMLPIRGGSQVLTSPYSITVDGSRLLSHLPYMGVAYNVPYGGGKVLGFEADIASYREEAAGPDSRKIILTTDNGEDLLTYTLTVFTNGKATVDVMSRNREPISFLGSLNPEFDPRQPEE